ncbi:hypothetical protein AnigIFM50267_010850 [Aspergillus niger]|uniref:Uncharacterized protein n=1 Tax=Aspergillus welwitschiae TaxID=1341132 RepID=A0A3F3QFD0_9EURO|nr:hypothetical protein BDQ94DRAFT_166869 [Aspergillus welwitschiae]RDH37709.1 hypothetical protein BDQ94DRAFT_166869 [Aspergillus welwitschiae]GKZ66016.1 hypothetical protein AnigIFM50267_010850 [Aspergillus niger]
MEHALETYRELEELAEGLTDEEIDNLEKELQAMTGPTSPSSPSDSSKDQTNPSVFWMDDVLTPKEKVELGRKSAIYYPSDTYWKIVCINMALHLAKRKEESSRDYSDVDNAVFENELDQCLEDFEIPTTVAPTTETLLEVTPENVTQNAGTE